MKEGELKGDRETEREKREGAGTAVREKGGGRECAREPGKGTGERRRETGQLGGGGGRCEEGKSAVLFRLQRLSRADL